MYQSIRGFSKFFIFAVMSIFILLTQGTVLMITKGRFSYILPKMWHWVLARAFAIKYEIQGLPNKNQQTLFMSNHLSYLDIPILGSIITGSFVAKSEVEDWPVFGLLCKLQQTAFIQRNRSHLKEQKNSLQQRLKQGQSLIIFPEGTSTDGKTVLPFKSSLFSLALGEGTENLYIQPITLSLLETDGRPIATQEDIDLYSWHRNMDTEMHDHLWRFAKSKGAKIRVTFHDPIRAHDFADRKILAKTCYESVSKGLIPALAA